MNWIARHVANAKKIVDLYQGEQPLHHFLQNYFKQNKHMGSKDRRSARALVYEYFRFGKALNKLGFEERLAVSSLLCSPQVSEVYSYVFDVPQSTQILPLNKRIQFIHSRYAEFNILDVFPFGEHLSSSINKLDYCLSITQQPDVFVRVDEGFEKQFEKDCKENELTFSIAGLPGNCYRFPPATNLNWLNDKSSKSKRTFAEIQDLSSQKTQDYFKIKKDEFWIDACAGAGGKSLLLKDLEPSVSILALDVRENILKNYENRMENHGFSRYHCQKLEKNWEGFMPKELADGIIVDAPCSGSGTWSRTPEMLHYFKEEQIETYHSLQVSLVKKTMEFLKEGKTLTYITCSVFAKENEEVVNKIISETSLKLDTSSYIKGYKDKADTMFVARFIL
ncbi:MAG: 16S rRNA (cytosine967-C5)-methyltransferase [Sphingobacteriales bacterium]|jgi:16S rRNA (cytosine967-C5)-methyltransferase